jgi:hypothetical protein
MVSLSIVVSFEKIFNGFVSANIYIFAKQNDKTDLGRHI